MSFVSDVFRGLEYLHNHEIIHVDVHPDNIFIKRIGESEFVAVLGDFGSQFEFDRITATSQGGAHMGYYPPELTVGDGSIRISLLTEKVFTFCNISASCDVISKI